MIKQSRILGVGIDASSMNIGIAVMSFPFAVLLWHYEVHLRQFKDRDAKMLYMVSWLDKQMHEIARQSRHVQADVAFVGIEAPFKGPNYQTPIILGEVMGICTAATVRRLGRVPILVAPAAGKKALSGSGNAGKDDMRRAVMLQFFGGKPGQDPADFEITEHWADGVGICLAAYNQIKNDASLWGEK